MAFRHGGPHQSSFWISGRKMKRAVQMDDALSIINECEFAVYVKINNPDMVSHRRTQSVMDDFEPHRMLTLA